MPFDADTGRGESCGSLAGRALAPFERDLLLIGHRSARLTLSGSLDLEPIRVSGWAPVQLCLGRDLRVVSAAARLSGRTGPRGDREPRANRDRSAGDLAAVRRYLDPAVVPRSVHGRRPGRRP
jgi:hypothetical protein